ncbi:hypothetical protein BDF14DRAFT_1844841 [Spinellus fusiger]|nr:hypothetical protein BDF14DRAFT_1844841 [Spinellus fusiger]
MAQDPPVTLGPVAHLLPFGIKTQGHVNADQYFSYEPMTGSSGCTTDSNYSTVIHGRLLVGVRLPSEDTQAHLWSLSGSLQKQTFSKQNPPLKDVLLWKKDNPPKPSDARRLALQHWFDISQLIHSPLSEEEDVPMEEK